MLSHLVRAGQLSLAVVVTALAATSCTNDLSTGPAQPTQQAGSPQQQAFHPSGSMTLAAGTYNWTDVNIPAGVVVTMTGNVNIVASGDATVAGTLAGDCVGLSIAAAKRLTLAGTVTNACSGAAPAAGAPAMKLVGLGGYTIDHASVQTSGAFSITNDTALLSRIANSPTATLGRGALASRSPTEATPRRSATPSTGIPCDFVAGTLIARPRRAADGAPGITGDSGRSGGRWIAACAGDMDVVGLFSLTSQDGGNGGNGSAAGGTATGGDGGRGGDLLVEATGAITFEANSMTVLNSGAGGKGGNADGTAASDGGAAGAVAGDGGAPGLIKVFADDGIELNGGIVFNVGNGGNGGNATATANDGVTCKAGGKATAIGGDGGSTPDKSLQAIGNVVGNGSVAVSGGVPGVGGTAHAHGGNGANGAAGCEDGQPGGAQSATGGDGGSAFLRDADGIRVADGGKGGDAIFDGGKGGNGLDKCTPTSTTKGGNGGKGGDATGAAGLGGFGRGAGAKGAVSINLVGNGGDAGGGSTAGAVGPGGTNTVAPNPKTTIVEPSFKPGNPGKACPTPPPPPATSKFGVVIQLDTAKTNDKDKIDALLGVKFNRTLQIVEQGTGTTAQITVGPLFICDLPFVLTNTGPASFDAAGNFSADIFGTVNLGTHGIQPILVTIKGQIGADAAIRFTIVVSPAPTATFKFGPVTYDGTGRKQ